MNPRIDEEITFRKLETLLAFMDSGNLARAAEQLATSAVSVHRALHSLETGTRCVLFRHEGRNLIPTDAAHVLADVARDVIRTMAEGLRATQLMAGYAGDRIRIGSLYSLSSGTVPAVIMALKLRKPDIQTELVLGSNTDLLRKLRDGTVDASIMGRPEDDADLEMLPIFDDEIFFAAQAASRHAQASEVDLSSCADEPFVSLTDGFVTRSDFVEAFRVAGFTPNVVMRTGDIFSLMNLVSGGIGCTLLPGRIRSVLPANVVLRRLQPKFRVAQEIALCFLRTRERDPNLLALLAACRQLQAK
jgi:LysR family malonate utilization transcriptional regulator